MTKTEAFDKFLNNIKVDNPDIFCGRYKEITKKLNKTFRDTDSETANCLQVGSYGRYTGIKGISDLDMLYIMPKSTWDTYKDTPSELLRKTRDALLDRYPQTTIKVDRLVVDVFFGNFTFEVQPVYEERDGEEINYKYPDTKTCTYKITKPRQEQNEMINFKQNHGEAHRHLCKMLRAWKNNVGVGMGGLLIDTLTHRFLSNHSEYDNANKSQYGEMCRDFFEYLKDEPKHTHYQALGSDQDVKAKHPFRSKAKIAYKKANEAIKENDESKRHDIWREIFGRQFPKSVSSVVENKMFSSDNPSDHEEFIEDKYPIDVKYDLKLDCIIMRDGFREHLLSELLLKGQRISRVRSLDFTIKTDAPLPYEVKWKARNVGTEAIKRNCLRGEIIDSNRKNNVRHESADFFGPHYMEAYIIKNGIVVARDRIEVPIQ